MAGGPQLVYQPSPHGNVVPLMPSPGHNVISLPGQYVSAGHSPGHMLQALPVTPTGAHHPQYMTTGAPTTHGYYGGSPLVPMMSLPQQVACKSRYVNQLISPISIYRTR